MMKNRVEAVINLDNIEHNYKYIKTLVGDNCRVMAVVKADAYGHGALRVCKTLEKAGVDFFAVACLEEAIALRNYGIKSDILILGITDSECAPTIREHNLIQTAGSREYCVRLSEGGGARIHLKVDTGMSRLGIYCHNESDIPSVKKDIAAISGLPDIKIEGIFTHFADSDNPSPLFTEKQFAVFCALLDEIKAANINVGIRHCCNSAAILKFPEMRLDMVRAGIILYGLLPSPEIKDQNLLPCMTLKSRIASVSKLKKGDSISYGCTLTANRDITSAVISIGYADGFSRALSEKAYVKIGGKKAKILGKICMDLCVADVSGIKCAPGDEVIIFENTQDIDVLAGILGTINYEIICLLKQRVKITYTHSN
ncbi:MAG TPA: alanine racemase [Clostridiales bacterium]|nr:alanine racemase [Eubacteriales bacterium]HBR31263.1 alanine racemase [Clostridiales bacterium]